MTQRWTERIASDGPTGWCFCKRCKTLFIGSAGMATMHYCPATKASPSGYGRAVTLKNRWAERLAGGYTERTETKRWEP